MKEVRHRTSLGVRVGIWALVVVVAIVGGSLLTNLSPIKDLYDKLFNRQTFVATGDVVLKRLQEQKQLVAATGTFEVPVVVCNGSPDAYDLSGPADEDDRTPAQQLLDACDGLFDDKATLLVSSEVDAVIDLSELTAGDIEISGSRVTVRLPPIEMAEPRVDAERGISVIAMDGSIPIIGGDLPEDYQSLAAGEAKDAIAEVADDSGLPELGARSATSFFENLLSALGFTEVDVVIEDQPVG